ncbi:MAG TPA: hypothetical protein VGN84_02190 [Solirubrobacterales bacterium]|jgi:hypothetical protein|nr:hypothetical protein [Solirubrobacterales bacterium]
MRKQRTTIGVLCTAILAMALASFGFAGSASAFSPEFKKFEFCPYTNAEVKKCTYALTKGGEVVMGSKKVPIVNTVTLQGGFAVPNEAGVSKFFEATNGITLSKTPQPLPGGLAGLVNCKEISNILLRITCEATFENGLTGVNTTLELARPASEIQISETNLSTREGVALKLPIKIHLENPFLGSGCYVGSSSSPIYWNLTTGITTPPGPNKSIEGVTGEIEFLEGGRILELQNNVLVDNAWAAPGATGCGGFLVELILDPILNLAAGLPASAGHNSAVLKNTLYLTTAAAVKKDHTEHP